MKFEVWERWISIIRGTGTAFPYIQSVAAPEITSCRGTTEAMIQWRSNRWPKPSQNKYARTGCSTRKRLEGMMSVVVFMVTRDIDVGLAILPVGTFGWNWWQTHLRKEISKQL